MTRAPWAHTIGSRCRRCLCRFDAHGLRTYGSATCLRLRDKKPRGGRLAAARWARSLSGD